MKNSIFLVFCLSVHFPRATTDSETVWLKDITTRFQTDKRTHSDRDLPDQLTFHLRRKSHSLTLNLRRNHDIDPNADIYIVRNLNDGQSVLEKSQNLEKEDVAYYQDRENGAFMTASCVKRSRGQCDIVINGNIRIQDTHYDLRPLEDDVTSRNSLETTDFLGKQYVLEDQSYIKRDMSVRSEDETNVHEKNVEEKLTELLQRVSHGQDERQVLRPDVKLSFQNVAGVHNKLKTGEDMSRTNDKDDKIRKLKKEYYVKMLVVTDSTVYDLFKTTVNSSLDNTKAQRKTHKRIRRFYSHIMNGVNQLYKGIDDPNIAIHVSIREFVILQFETQFPHNISQVYKHNGMTTISADDYLIDLRNWDERTASKQVPKYDTIILFTRLHIVMGDKGCDPGKHVIVDRKKKVIGGVSYQDLKCNPGQRAQLVISLDYFVTTSVAAHELGHGLGAAHDGDKDSADCRAEDKFIMTPAVPTFNPDTNYSKNPWHFSTCTVNKFRKSLKTKKCLTEKPVYADGERDEWNKFMLKLPGEKYTPSMQCHMIIGPGSALCGPVTDQICRFMRCTYPNKTTCIPTFRSAATGTKCGENMWCKEGECVHKDSK